VAHYPNKNVFSDLRNLLSDSFRCDGRLFHSPGPAAANGENFIILTSTVFD